MSSAVCFEAGSRLRLCLPRSASGRAGYPTDGIQKGLLLEYEGASLAGEGVGFGVPMLKKSSLETVFPGSVRVSLRGRSVVAEYSMDVVERLALKASPLLKNPLASSFKDVMALLHRAYPAARGLIAGASAAARKAFGITNVFERTRSSEVVRVEYRFDRGRREVEMTLDASGVRREGLAELILMNEQGADYFTTYADSDGVLLEGDDVGTWFRVTASEALFLDPARRVRFSLRRMPGARLFCGRELVRGRLAWAGFAYVLPPSSGAFRCSLSFGAYR